MFERFEILESALAQLMEERKYAAAKAVLATMNPGDIAAMFGHMKERAIVLLFRLLPKDVAAETFAEMAPEEQELLIGGFSDNELKELLDGLSDDDAADLAEEMPASVVKRLLKQADPEMRHAINQLLRYPENSAGSIMTTEYVTLRPDMTVGESILRIRRQGVDKETIYTCYVTEHRVLVGVVTVKELLLHPDDDTLVKDIMSTNLLSVSTSTDREEASQMLSRYNFLALPVVDGENRLVGIVTFDDAMDVLEDAATEDMELMGGMTPSEKTYLRSTPFELFKNRVPWLMLLMVSATFTGLIITAFEGALAAQVALTAFIPMLMGTGGNSGAQSSVTVIRALSLGELRLGDVWRVIGKELCTAALCGLSLAAVCFGKIWLVDRMLMGNLSITWQVDLVVCLTLAVTVVAAKLVGCTLPLGAKALKLDPAVMASPFISTIVDALSLLVYFLFARTVLGV